MTENEAVNLKISMKAIGFFFVVAVHESIMCSEVLL